MSGRASLSRGSLLLLLAEARLPTSFALTPEVVDQLAGTIVEVCSWQWA